MAPNNYNWLHTARRLQAIAQAGLEFCHTGYDRDRYQQIRDISIEIIENYTAYEQEEIIGFFASDKGYPTPKVDVRAAIFKENNILMVKEKTDGKWSLPGGWADQHLSLSENIIKESKEEAGVNVEPVRIISVLERNRHNTQPIPFGCYKIFVLCNLKGGEFTENTETSDSGYFPLNDLPTLSSERNTYEQIRDCFDSQSNDWRVIFD